MAIYTGYTGRVVLTGPSQRYNLIVHKYVLSTKTQEEDVTTAQDVPVNAGRYFVAPQVPRIDVQLDGFWTSLNNPFGDPDPVRAGFSYGFQLFLDKASFTPNVDADLLVLSCEITSSVRDVARYMVTGVIQGPINLTDAGDDPNAFPRFFPLQ